MVVDLGKSKFRSLLWCSQSVFERALTLRLTEWMAPPLEGSVAGICAQRYRDWITFLVPSFLSLWGKDIAWAPMIGKRLSSR